MSQEFSPAMYALRTEDLIPDDFEDDPDVLMLEYIRCASQVNRQHVLESVLSDLDCEDSPIYDLIDKAIDEPFVPGERPRENIVILAKLGQAILNLVAKSIDDQANLRMAIGGVR